MPEKKEIDTKIYESKDKIKARLLADARLLREQLDAGESWTLSTGSFPDEDGHIYISVTKKSLR